MGVLVTHVVIGGAEADVQVASAHANSLQGSNSQAGRSQVIEGQHHKAPRLANCVQGPDLSISLQSQANKVNTNIPIQSER